MNISASARADVMKKRSSNLFSFFKPVSSPSPSNGTSSAKTPSNARGRKKQKFGTPSTASKQNTPKLDRQNDHVNGEAGTKDVAMETETVNDATPTASGRKRPLPSDSEDSEEEIGVRKVICHPENCRCYDNCVLSSLCVVSDTSWSSEEGSSHDAPRETEREEQS